MNDIETNQIKRDVEVQLTPEERAELREKACAALDRVDEHASMVKTLKLEAKEARATAKKGTITRMLDCREEQDFRLGEFRVVVAATGAVVETRALTAEERQTMLDVGAPTVGTTGRKKKMKPDEPPGDGETTTGAH